MPEYMDYNDYGEHKSKRQKILSAVGLGMAIAWLVFLVVWVNLRSPENLRSKFDAISSMQHSFSDAAPDKTNSFLDLKNQLESGTSFTLSGEFRSKYSEVYLMLLMDDKELAKNKPKMFDKDGYVTLALPYVISSREDDSGSVRRIMGIDFLMLPYSAAAENGESVKLGEPIRYTLRYSNDSDTETPKVVSEPFSKKRFRLSFYSISVKIEADENISSLGYNAKLSHPLTKSESENFKFSKNIVIKDNEKLESKLISGEGISDTEVQRDFALTEKNGKSVTAVISYDDLMYNKLDEITFSAGNIRNGKFTITIN